MYWDSINIVILPILLYDTTIVSFVLLRLGLMLEFGLYRSVILFIFCTWPHRK